MNITRDNYEIWAIDYLEGKLSTSESAIFMVFLAENSDLADELDNIRDAEEIPSFSEQTIDFNYLKKNYNSIKITPSCFEEFCVAYHEGDLDIHGQKNLLEYIGADSNKAKVFETYKYLKVQPNKSIVYNNKKYLKQSKGISIVLSPKNIAQLVSSIAAVIVLFIILNYNNFNHINSTKPLVNTSQSPEFYKTQNSINTVNRLPKHTFQNIPKQSMLSIKEKEYETQYSKILKQSTVDTSRHLDPFIPITRKNITEIPVSINIPSIGYSQSSNKDIFRETNKSFARNTFNKIRNRSQLLSSKREKFTLDAMLRRSVEGINQVAEAELKYNSEIDYDGKIIAFALSSERFNIKKKIRSN